MKELEQGHIYKEEYDLLPEEDKKKYYNACFSKRNGTKVEIVGWAYFLWSKRKYLADKLSK